ncbi:MAG: RlmE family RNA methyltransferase [Deltaproteobacteria bacterium]|nr:RlmE family RNA methyltransferase [Deltaproteobacteria bacterium]
MAHRTKTDAYYHRAKKEGYAARSVYKLQDMDRRYSLLKPGQRVLDLGCHPGSWLQYAAAKVGPQGRVLGLDLKPPTVATPPWVEFLEADLLETAPADLGLDPDQPPVFDLVLSDVAPKTTGVRHADELRSLALTEAALELALATLAPGGSFLAKVFAGPGVDQVIRRVKTAFSMGKGHKPPSSRAESKEIYILGRGRKAPAPPGNHLS